jgi:hypothetical protein
MNDILREHFWSVNEHLILDLKLSRMKKNKWKRTVSVLMVATAFGAIGYFAGQMLATSMPKLPTEIITMVLIMLIPAIIFTITFHEAGHALIGVLVGFNFKMYVVGPFMWVKENGDWKFKWNTNVNTMGGMVICLPNSTEDLPRRFSLFAAGGPLASLLLVALALSGYYILRPADNLFTQGLSGMLLITSMISVAIFIVTIIPLHAGGFASDGARIIRLLRGGEAAQLEVLILKIVADSTGGVRPRLLNKNELMEALHLAQKRKSPFMVYLHAFLYQQAWDTGDVEGAESYLTNYIQEVDSIPQGLQGMVWMEASFFYALEKKDAGKATEYWQRFKPSAMIPGAQVLALKVALHVLKGEHSDALLKAEQAIKELPAMLDQGMAVVLRERLQNLQRIAERQE